VAEPHIIQASISFNPKELIPQLQAAQALPG
jgi:hypothetical protein